MICLRSFSMPEQAAIAPLMLADLMHALTAHWASVIGISVPLLFNALSLGGVA